MVGRPGLHCSVRRRRDSIAGFTLIELLVVIAVAGVLLAFAVPSFQQMMANTRVRSTAQSFQAALLRTRSEALKRNTTITLQANSGGWTNGWAIVDQTQVPNLVIETGAPSSKVTLTASGGVTQVNYVRSGRLQPGSTVPFVRIEDTSGKAVDRCVKVADLTGRPVLEVEDHDSGDDC